MMVLLAVWYTLRKILGYLTIIHDLPLSNIEDNLTY